MAVFKFRGNGL